MLNWIKQRINYLWPPLFPFVYHFCNGSSNGRPPSSGGDREGDFLNLYPKTRPSRPRTWIVTYPNDPGTCFSRGRGQNGRFEGILRPFWVFVPTRAGVGRAGPGRTGRTGPLQHAEAGPNGQSGQRAQQQTPPKSTWIINA